MSVQSRTWRRSSHTMPSPSRQRQSTANCASPRSVTTCMAVKSPLRDTAVIVAPYRVVPVGCVATALNDPRFINLHAQARHGEGPQAALLHCERILVQDVVEDLAVGVVVYADALFLKYRIPVHEIDV